MQQKASASLQVHPGTPPTEVILGGEQALYFHIGESIAATTGKPEGYQGQRLYMQMAAACATSHSERRREREREHDNMQISHTHTHTLTLTYAYLCVHINIYIYIFACVHIYTHTLYIYIYCFYLSICLFIYLKKNIEIRRPLQKRNVFHKFLRFSRFWCVFSC